MSTVLDEIRRDQACWRWPARELRYRIELALGLMDPAVRDVHIHWLTDDGDGPERARASIWGLSLAGMQGYQAVGVVGEDIFLLRRGDDEAALAPLPFSLPRSVVGDLGAVGRLVESLGTTMEDRHYVIHIRRPLPSDLDADSVARAVDLWLMAIERGDWVGHHAVYEDDGISLEISLTGARRRDQGSGPMLTIGPTLAMERLDQVFERLVDLALILEDEAPALPVVALLAADAPWHLSRGHVVQGLYGVPTRFDSSWTDHRRVVEAHHHRSAPSLFSDPLCRRIGALWWAEPHGGDPLGFRAWAHLNPWTDHPSAVPPFPGLRFAPRDPEVDRGVDPTSRPTVMSWYGAEPVQWSHSR